MFLIIILYFFFASTFTFAKAALDYAPPIFLVAVRFLLAGVLLLSYYYSTREHTTVIKRKDYGLFAQAILFTFYLSFATDVWALQYLSSSKACLIYNISPFITALLTYCMYGRTITVKQIIALIGAFGAFIPLLLTFSSSELLVSQISCAELVLIISITIACYGWIILKELVVDKGYSSLLVNGIGTLGGGFLALMHAFITEGVPVIESHGAYQPPLLLAYMEQITGPYYLDIGMFIFYTLLLVFIAHIFCYNLYAQLLKKYSNTFLSCAGALTPLFAALLGWVFLNEQLSWQFLITLATLSVALYVFYQDELVENTNT